MTADGSRSSPAIRLERKKKAFTAFMYMLEEGAKIKEKTVRGRSIFLYFSPLAKGKLSTSLTGVPRYSLIIDYER